MHSSVIMTAALAATVAASPILDVVTKVVATTTNVATVTNVVTEGQAQPSVVQAQQADVEQDTTVTVVHVATVTAGQNNAATQQSVRPMHNKGQGWGWHSKSVVQVVTSSQQPQQQQQQQPQATSSSSYVQIQSQQANAQTSQAQPQTSAAAAAAPTGYQDTCIYHHNLHRANHSSPDIAWDDDLASSAQQIAESCVYAHNVDVAGGGYGQNIAAGVESNNISAIITDLFYNGEEPYFADQYGKDNPDMTNFEQFGHFTQIVWKATTHVGCFTQYCQNGLANVGSGVSPYFTVCNYKGPGNYADEYAANVLKPKGNPTVEWNAGQS